jgi:radical SAM protein with 4Fe4S-binding SPASM domain
MLADSIIPKKAKRSSLGENVHGKLFNEVWNNSLVFVQLCNLSAETCMTCHRFEICRGGCPEIAYHTYHDINMHDPECLVNLRMDLNR